MNTHLLLFDQNDAEDVKRVLPEPLICEFSNCAFPDRSTANTSLDDHEHSALVTRVTSVTDVTTAIRSIRNYVYAEARIVVLDADPSWTHARACFRAGANDYLSLLPDVPPTKLSNLYSPSR